MYIVYFFFFKWALLPKMFRHFFFFFLVGGVLSLISCLTVRFSSDIWRRALWWMENYWWRKRSSGAQNTARGLAVSLTSSVALGPGKDAQPHCSFFSFYWKKEKKKKSAYLIRQLLWLLKIKINFKFYICQ